MNIIPEMRLPQAAHGGSDDCPWAINDNDVDRKRISIGAVVAGLGNPYVDLERQYVAVPFDVASGPQKGLFSDCPVSRESFHTKYLSFKPTAKGYTAKSLDAITESNPGFDAREAWNSGDFDSFAGKLVGLIVSYDERRNSYDGSVELWPSYTFAPLSAIREGKYKIPGTRHLDGTRDEPTEGTPIDLSELDGDKSNEGSDDELWGGDDDDDCH